MKAVCPPCPSSSLDGYSSTEQYKKEDVILLKVFVFLSSQEKQQQTTLFLINASYFQAFFCVLRGSEEPEIRSAPIITREDQGPNQVGENKIRCWELNERMITATLTSQIHSIPSHLK